MADQNNETVDKVSEETSLTPAENVESGSPRRPSIGIEDFDFTNNTDKTVETGTSPQTGDQDEQAPVSSDNKETSSNEQVPEGRMDTASAKERPSIEAIENLAMPEQEDGPPVETVAQPLSREASVVSERKSADGDVVGSKEIPDPTQTPPPPAVMVDGTTIDEIDNTQIINILSPEDGEVQSIASSIEVPVYNRAELLERYQQAVEERSALQTLNSQFQHKLAEYFKKKKTDDRQQEIEKNVSDQEQRYIKYLANLDELQTDLSSEQESYKEQIEELKERCSEKQSKVQEVRDEFRKHKSDIAKQALNSRSGRQIPIKDIEQYQQLEQKKDHEVMLVRLENIKLKNRLKKREMQLKAKEELAEGLHLIDFEQLKIENQTYNEKIEERNEELLKLRKKITTTVQVLTHLKEKLQFVQGENGEQRNKLKTVDANVAQKRDILTRTKQARDALRIDNVKLRQKCGLLGNEPLLRDYEERRDESVVLTERVEKLKMKHAELTMNATGVKKKIEHTKLPQ
ncbi:coiled-coil domain-containing protein 96-like [Dendronephthya gigantea]|uniref:coiled-coil domain-containing protein 96-like n=1 Tax=Dendronephthya gigantea TaxID=151771 RepID=UPI00106DBD5A|nr:coiled-coil domain-containing protein 96-like [Dendronephthya gigantea]